MQAILKSKHKRFCNWLQEIRDRQLIDDHQLNELEKEMEQFYEIYQEKREDIRKIISAYEERQKGIRNRIKGFKRSEFKVRTNDQLIQEEQIDVQ